MKPNRAVMLAGYALSVPPLLIYARVIREQRLRLMALIVLGNALILAGWATESAEHGWLGSRKRRSVVINSVSLVALPAVYLVAGRRRRMRETAAPGG